MPTATKEKSELQELAREYRAIRGGKNSSRRCAEIYKELESAVGSHEAAELLRAPRLMKSRPPDARMLRDAPGYSITRNGQVTSPSGHVLTHRWSWFKGEERLPGPIPHVKLPNGEKSVYWLFVSVGFLESPSETRERRQAAKADVPRAIDGTPIAQLKKMYNDDTEAGSEDPEMFGLDEDRNPVE
jgi:hypothetical protein